MTSVKRLAAAITVVTAGIAGAVVAQAGPASADAYRCFSNVVCLYYNTNYGGAMWASAGEVPNYNLSWIVFDNSGAGAGQRVNDNAASLRNGAWYLDVEVYEHSWWRGRSVKVQPGLGAPTLGEVTNRASSHAFIG